MAVNRVTELSRCVRYVQEQPGEAHNLFKDLLIGVTNFFRDKEAFDVLREKVIPELFENRSAGRPVRIWVPGCATGEEPYTVAILCRDFMDSLKNHFLVQIFATDLNNEAIETARLGNYPESISTDVPPQFIERYFTKEGALYRVKKEIRDMVVFALQNVITDPPFSRIDLVTCRNLLIYLRAELQNKVLPLFHYALNPDGFLFLGSSESTGEGLKFELARCIRRAVTQKTEIRSERLRVKTERGELLVNLVVKPISEPASMKGHLLVLFEDVPSEEANETEAEPRVSTEGEEHPRIRQLEHELLSTREYLQSAVEELETSNEELQSTNEELQSSNEELQSTNEELQTSKEGLQSVNEELNTVNSELQQKIDELTRTSNDLNNLLASTNIGTIFLDTHLNVQRFTPTMTDFINLIQTDVGRPLAHIVTNLKHGRLVEDAQEVLRTLIPKEQEIQINDDRWYSMRILPYRTVENVIDGVVITFVDTSLFRRAMKAAFEDAQRQEVSIINTVREPLLLLDRDLSASWHKYGRVFRGLSSFA